MAKPIQIQVYEGDGVRRGFVPNDEPEIHRRACEITTAALGILANEEDACKGVVDLGGTFVPYDHSIRQTYEIFFINDLDSVAHGVEKVIEKLRELQKSIERNGKGHFPRSEIAVERCIQIWLGILETDR